MQLIRIENYFYFLITVFLLISCAQIVVPDGGEVDRVPPKVLSSLPINQSVNFKGNELVLVFDEYVQIKDAKKEVIISPPLNKFPEFNLKGKKLIIPFGEELKKNTTYTFNFGNAIVDLNENNVLDSNIFVFSTGDSIDNAVVKGNVKFAEDLKPAEDVLVMLYKDTTDSVQSLEKPYYATITKEDGSYRIENVAKGCYKIFALIDENANMLFDQPTETVGFSDSLVCVDTLSNRDIYVFEPSLKKTYLKKSKHESYGKIALYFSNNVDSSINIYHEYDIEVSNKKEFSLIEKTENNDTLYYWFQAPEGVENLVLYVNDTVNKINDTLEFAIKNFESLYKINKKEKDTVFPTEKIKINVAEGAKFDLNRELSLTSVYPINSFNKNNFIITQGADTIKFNLKANISQPRRLVFSDFEWLQDSSYTIMVFPYAIDNIYGIPFKDTLKVNFKTKSELDYTTLSIDVKTDLYTQKNLVIELLDDNKKFIASQKVKNNKVYFDYLKGGKYFLKLIFDDDNSGDWTSGDFYKKRKAEEIFFYPKKIELQTGWDMELKWDIDGY